jgi:tRNA (guanine-N7-)-methyltransferase
LENVVFLRADFRLLYPLLAPGSLDAVYLHFPDPNVRPKFRKHRVFCARFL